MIHQISFTIPEHQTARGLAANASWAEAIHSRSTSESHIIPSEQHRGSPGVSACPLPKDLSMASVLAVIFNRDNEFLLILRPGELQQGTSVSGRPGQWCLPGGKIKGTETREEAIVREVREEVGLTVFPVRQLADFGDQAWFHCGVSENAVIALNTRECANYVWCTPENLTTVGFISDFRRLQMVLAELGSSSASGSVKPL